MSKVKEKNVEKVILFEELLKYSDEIAYTYFKAHANIFAKDSVGLDDLKQEARIICFKMFEQYSDLHGKNEFDLKKFTGRAVGWKMNDFLKCAKIDVKHFEHVDQKDLLSLEEKYYEKKEDNLKISGNLKCGFDINEIFKYFTGRDLKILKLFVKYNENGREIKRHFVSKDWYKIKRIWKTAIKPKVKSIITLLQLNLKKED
jgi:hypothetical protein